MIVYIVMGCVSYEGEYIKGVYLDKKKAKMHEEKIKEEIRAGKGMYDYTEIVVKEVIE